jgi:phosphatidylglycerophosphate synthase
MIDRYLLGLQKRLLDPLAGILARGGIQADWITLTGFAVGLAAVPMLAVSAFIPALVCILLNRIFDGLDGAVARRLGPTDRGAFLDIALDFFVYGAVPLGFALADPHANALAATVLLVSFIGTGSSFLAFAAISHKRGEPVAAYPSKGIQFVGGLTEGAETIILFAAMCLFPQAFVLLAYLFSFFAFLTTLTRWWWGWRVFGTDRAEHG